MDEYYRNGLLFLANLEKAGSFKDYEEIIPTLTVDDAFIKENFRKPVEELVGHRNVGAKSSEKDMLKLLRKCFEVSGKSISMGRLLEASFFDTEKGTCSYCGEIGEVFANRQYVFPFERKIDSISSENARLRFCKRCGFILYSGMANLYQKGNLKFFFDSYNYKSMESMDRLFKDSDLRDQDKFNKIRSFKIPTYHPYETVFISIFEFVKNLYDKKMMSDLSDVANDVRLILTIGRGQIYQSEMVPGNILEKTTRFFKELVEEGQNLFQERVKAGKEIRGAPSDFVLAGFFNNLTVEKGSFKDNTRLRETFVKSLFNSKTDFVTLNEIIMERLKRKKPPPYHQRRFITVFEEVFDLSEEKELFTRISGLGYSLGRQMKGTNLENYVWNVFRARGFEDFVNVVVELQMKMKPLTLDLRPIYEHKQNWREAKAILLNSMVNALSGGEEK